MRRRGEERNSVARAAAQQLTAGAVEEVDHNLFIPIPAGPAPHRHDRSVRRQRHRVELALVADVLRGAQHRELAPACHFPHARRFVLRGGHRPAPGRIGGDSSDDRDVHTGFQPWQRLGGGFGGDTLQGGQ